MKPILSNEAELYFERGGPIYRFIQRLAPSGAEGHPLQFRILAFIAITWVPLLVLGLIEGHALGPTPKQSLLLDFGTYARFFVAVPLLIVAERVIGPRLAGTAMHFIHGGFVRPEDYPEFERAVARAARWRESKWVELLLVALAVTGAWAFTLETLHGYTTTWRSTRDPSGNVSFTGVWYHAIALPILQYFWYRWIWRVLNWGRFLWAVSRLKLNLVPTHADQAGGLGFLGTTHMAFGILGFCLSAVLSGEVAFLLVYEHAAIDSFKMPFIALLVLIELFLLGPLFIFSPMLMRFRLAWLRAYSLLVLRYNREFHDKWIAGNAPADEPLLGSADIQSLADLGTSFEYIKGMKVVVFSTRVMLQLAVVASIPCLPLLLLVMPLGELLNLFAGAVF